MPTLTDVMSAISSERRYQDMRWGDTKSSGRPGSGERSIDEFALYIFGYSEDAGVAVEDGRGTEAVMDIVRKVCGLCRACLEQHGDPDAFSGFRESDRGNVAAAVGDIETNAHELVRICSHFGDRDLKLHSVSEVYSCCVSAMLKFGAPLRECA